MTVFYQRILAWLAGEEGQDLIEYAMLAFFIAAALVATLSLVAPELSTVFSRIISAMPP